MSIERYCVRCRTQISEKRVARASCFCSDESRRQDNIERQSRPGHKNTAACVTGGFHAMRQPEPLSRVLSLKIMGVRRAHKCLNRLITHSQRSRPLLKRRRLPRWIRLAYRTICLLCSDCAHYPRVVSERLRWWEFRARVEGLPPKWMIKRTLTCQTFRLSGSFQIRVIRLCRTGGPVV